MGKRGSHIDIVLSFVIFVSLLIFIFSVFAPKIGTQSDKQVMIDYLKAKLINNFTSNLTTFTIQITDTIKPNADCVRINGIVNDIRAQGIDETKLIIKNESDNILNYDVSGNSLIVGTGKGFSGFLKFYHSKDLESSLCTTCGLGGCGENINGYEIGLIREINIPILFNIRTIAAKYNSDYEGLKSELGLPPGTEFAFIFVANDGTTIVAEPTEIPKTNVYTEEIPVMYSDNEGNILEGFLIIKVW